MDELKPIKEMVEQVILDETKNIQILRSLISKQNEQLQNTILDKITILLAKWSYTPPSDMMKELEQLQGG
jgi:hypothetical protein